eukprot:TRINITY_DN62297_c0_g1_i1.p1 TRINITY_DN62297_c0_g1~~TRINITY_DN62297_c0_g1_i1.p1  ORF type:complete len:1471 (+),score=206.66 TRINITY_DN62297_c0_g1_i1:72-4415(+)
MATLVPPQATPSKGGQPPPPSHPLSTQASPYVLARPLFGQSPQLGTASFVYGGITHTQDTMQMRGTPQHGFPQSSLHTPVGGLVRSPSPVRPQELCSPLVWPRENRGCAGDCSHRPSPTATRSGTTSAVATATGVTASPPVGVCVLPSSPSCVFRGGGAGGCPSALPVGVQQGTRSQTNIVRSPPPVFHSTRSRESTNLPHAACLGGRGTMTWADPIAWAQRLPLPDACQSPRACTREGFGSSNVAVNAVANSVTATAVDDAQVAARSHGLRAESADHAASGKAHGTSQESQDLFPATANALHCNHQRLGCRNSPFTSPISPPFRPGVLDGVAIGTHVPSSGATAKSAAPAQNVLDHQASSACEPGIGTLPAKSAMSTEVGKHAPTRAVETRSGEFFRVTQPSSSDLVNPGDRDPARDTEGVSDSETRRAILAVHLFFTRSQVCALANAPPAYFVTHFVLPEDKQSTALGHSLNRAVTLLKSESAQGQHFRAELLKSLQNSDEKGTLDSASVDSNKAVNISVEAEILDMNGPQETELVDLLDSIQVEDDSMSDSTQTLVACDLGGSPNRNMMGSVCDASINCTTINETDSTIDCAQQQFPVPMTASEALSGDSVNGCERSVATVIASASPLRDLSVTASETQAEFSGEMSSMDFGGELPCKFFNRDDDYADLHTHSDGAVGDEARQQLARSDVAETKISGCELPATCFESIRGGSEASTRLPSEQALDTVLAGVVAPGQPLPARRGNNSSLVASKAAGAGLDKGGTTAWSSSTHRQSASGPRSSCGSGGHGMGQSASVTSQPCFQISPLRRQRNSVNPPEKNRPPSSPTGCRSPGRCLPAWMDLKDQHLRERSASHDDVKKRSSLPMSARASISPNRPVGGETKGQPIKTPSGRRSSAESKGGVGSVGVANGGHSFDVSPLRMSNLGMIGKPKESPRFSRPSRVSSSDRLGIAAVGVEHFSFGGAAELVAKAPTGTTAAPPSGVSFADCGRYTTSVSAPMVREARTPAPTRPRTDSRQASALRSRRDGYQRLAVPAFMTTRDERSPSRPRANASGLDLYALGKLLGKGAFGKVNVGVHKLTEELTAMKLCERKRIAEVQAKKCLLQEVDVLKQLNGHANIIRLFEVIETPSQVVLVMEFAAGGDLLRYVRQRRRLTEDCSRKFFRQLLDGLAHIHKMGIVHRDIKLENLLLDSFGCLKIADFGVAVVVKPPGRRLQEHCGTPSYIAPEILLEAGYDGEPVDVWSAGIVLYAMLSGRVPFKGDSLLDLKRRILRGKFHVPSMVSQDASALLQAVIVVDPNRRLSVPEAQDHKWLNGVSNSADLVYESKANQPSLELLERVSKFGFPRPLVEESLREGRLNQATATYHLLMQQALRRHASEMPRTPSSSGLVSGGATPNRDTCNSFGPFFANERVNGVSTPSQAPATLDAEISEVGGAAETMQNEDEVA